MKKSRTAACVHLCAVAVILLSSAGALAASRPNILWFVVDDMSANFSCYGETSIETPHVDRLAREGVRFTNAHVTAPVCSTCRSAFLTGMYQASLGVHHHRQTGPAIRLPPTVQPVTLLLKEAGYYICNGDGLPEKGRKVRKKTDYNFVVPSGMYDGVDWSGRRSKQPFFMQVQLAGGKLRGGTPDRWEANNRRARERFGNNVPLDRVRLPRHYPNDPVLQRDWQSYLESVRLTDAHVGQVLSRLEAEGLLDSTLIIFMTDHGISHARGKQFLYREGTHIPFVVSGPGVAAGQVREDFIEHIDMAAISLAAAGLPVPHWMHGRDVLAPDYRPREAVFAARDRCDETIDMMRSVRTRDYLYIRNYQPWRPPLQPNRYKDGKEIVQRLRALRKEGTLADVHEDLLFRAQRPGEELYVVSAEGDELHNVAADPQYAVALRKLRRQLDQHLLHIRDAGLLPEPQLARIAAGDETIYEYVNRASQYPLAEILPLSRLTLLADPASLTELQRDLTHAHPAMRYWAAAGLRALGGRALPAKSALVKALEDDDASVRMTVAMALAAFVDRDRVGSFLLEEARQARDDAHALWALDGIKYLDRPTLLSDVPSTDVVRGEYSKRAFDYLTGGGLVFGTEVDYWQR